MKAKSRNGRCRSAHTTCHLATVCCAASLMMSGCSGPDGKVAAAFEKICNAGSGLNILAPAEAADGFIFESAWTSVDFYTGVITKSVKNDRAPSYISMVSLSEIGKDKPPYKYIEFDISNDENIAGHPYDKGLYRITAGISGTPECAAFEGWQKGKGLSRQGECKIFTKVDEFSSQYKLTESIIEYDQFGPSIRTIGYVIEDIKRDKVVAKYNLTTVYYNTKGHIPIPFLNDNGVDSKSCPEASFSRPFNYFDPFTVLKPAR